MLAQPTNQVDVHNHVLMTQRVSDVRGEFGNERQLWLLAGEPGRSRAEQGSDQGLLGGGKVAPPIGTESGELR